MSAVRYMKIPSSEYMSVTVTLYMHGDQKSGEVQFADDVGVSSEVSERAITAEGALKLATDHAKLCSIDVIAVHDDDGLWEPRWGTLNQQAS